MLEVGSGAGLSNMLAANVGAAPALGGAVPPGAYYARVRGVSACGQLGPASNEVLVAVP